MLLRKTLNDSGKVGGDVILTTVLERDSERTSNPLVQQEGKRAGLPQDSVIVLCSACSLSGWSSPFFCKSVDGGWRSGLHVLKAARRQEDTEFHLLPQAGWWDVREKITAAWPDYGRGSLSSFQLRECRRRALRKDWGSVGDFSIPENTFESMGTSKWVRKYLLLAIR